ncbi:MAG: L7Ae/L30e/S12e/Gadd45 family ribosomal protein [Gemmatimonadaceae bacterium]
MQPGAERRLLGLVGLGVRGRLAVVGVQQVRAAAQKGKLRFAVVAPDASRHSLYKVVPLLSARRIRFVKGPSAAALGAAAGRETTAVVGILDSQLARGIRDIVDADSRGVLQEVGS